MCLPCKRLILFFNLGTMHYVGGLHCRYRSQNVVMENGMVWTSSGFSVLVRLILSQHMIKCEHRSSRIDQEGTVHTMKMNKWSFKYLEVSWLITWSSALRGETCRYMFLCYVSSSLTKCKLWTEMEKQVARRLGLQ